MSLIEQAVKRLEELQRAGAEVSDGPASKVPTHGTGAGPPAEVPVRAVDARKGGTLGHGSASAREHESPALTLHGAGLASIGDRVEGDQRYLALDFLRLKQRGFVTPDSPKSQIAD